MCFLIFPYSVTCMWAALVGCALCSGRVVNVQRCQHHLAALHRALTHSGHHLAALHRALTHSGLYFHETCGESSTPCPMRWGRRTFGIFVASLTWRTWVRDGIRENTLLCIIGEQVRGCDNHGQSHSLLSSPVTLCFGWMVLRELLAKREVLVDL